MTAIDAADHITQEEPQAGDALDRGAPPPLDPEREFAAAWRRTAYALSELTGHPYLVLEPHRSIAPGEANWLRFIARASVPDLVLVVAALRELVAAMPRPQEGRGHDGG